MSNLSINIIPFNHPKQEMEFGFITENKLGYYPLPKWAYPRYLWENYKDELQDIERLYCNFLDQEEPEYKVKINLKNNWKFADHYYTKLMRPLQKAR